MATESYAIGMPAPKTDKTAFIVYIAIVVIILRAIVTKMKM